LREINARIESLLVSTTHTYGVQPIKSPEYARSRNSWNWIQEPWIPILSHITTRILVTGPCVMFTPS